MKVLFKSHYFHSKQIKEKNERLETATSSTVRCHVFDFLIIQVCLGEISADHWQEKYI